MQLEYPDDWTAFLNYLEERNPQLNFAFVRKNAKFIQEQAQEEGLSKSDIYLEIISSRQGSTI